jgi:hypothetical protein
VGDVVDDVVDHSQVAVDEVIPGTGLLPQTPVDKFPINVAQGHGDASSLGRRLMRGPS